MTARKMRPSEGHHAGLEKGVGMDVNESESQEGDRWKSEVKMGQRKTQRANTGQHCFREEYNWPGKKRVGLRSMKTMWGLSKQ